ncbi:MAG: RNA methyltransferase [Candidatus Diapherotrites archaeon]|nr:RNA methyltransferase [Candidatus Diapherotrites archaeon]
MQAKVILVEPMYEENIGYIARAMKNFGLSELVLVNPKCKHYTGISRSKAMHAQAILLHAKKTKSLKTALKGTDISVAVTGRTQPNKIFRTSFTVKQFAKQYKNSNKKLALVFGKETDGLTNEEVDECDFCITIPSSHEYRSLNLSHAGAIVFYELFSAFRNKKEKNTRFPHLKKAILENYFAILPMLDNVKNKPMTMQAFKSFLAKNPLNDSEIKNLLNVFAQIRKKLEQKK